MVILGTFGTGLGVPGALTVHQKFRHRRLTAFAQVSYSIRTLETSTVECTHATNQYLVISFPNVCRSLKLASARLCRFPDISFLF